MVDEVDGAFAGLDALEHAALEEDGGADAPPQVDQDVVEAHAAVVQGDRPFEAQPDILGSAVDEDDFLMRPPVPGEHLRGAFELAQGVGLAYLAQGLFERFLRFGAVYVAELHGAGVLVQLGPLVGRELLEELHFCYAQAASQAVQYRSGLYDQAVALDAHGQTEPVEQVLQALAQRDAGERD